MTQQSFWGYDEDGRSASSGPRLVYFVECGNYIKIGFTTRDVNDRIVELECGNPQKLKVYGTIAVKDGEDDRKLHEEFAFFHHRGEWFRKTPELMAAIDRKIQAERIKNAPITASVDLRIDFIETLEQATDVCLLFDCPSCKNQLFCVIGVVVHFWGTHLKALHMRCNKCGVRVPVDLSFVEKQRAA